MGNLFDYLKLIRPINCAMGSLGVFIGALVGAGLSITDFLPQVGLAVIIVFIFMAGANSLNDYYDRNIDKINHPKRPIPAGKIKAGTALDLSVIALIISVLLGALINLTAFLIVGTAALLIVLYEVQYKNQGLIGNVIISLLVALIFIFGGAAVLQYRLNIILALMAFFANLSREVVKDIEDIKGDINRFTLPKKIGVGPAGNLAALFIIIAVLISPLPVLPGLNSWLEIENAIGFQYLIIVIIADVVFITSTRDMTRNPKEASRLLKIGMVFALIAFLVGAIF
jgi:geranylgeranylglycerol-phosphate geranylgeranyltransferase